MTTVFRQDTGELIGYLTEPEGPFPGGITNWPFKAWIHSDGALRPEPEPGTDETTPAVCDADGRGERTVAFAPAGILRGNILPSPMAGCSYATAPIQRSLTIRVRGFPTPQRRAKRGPAPPRHARSRLSKLTRD